MGVFDSSGRWLGVVQVPHRWQVEEIGDRRITASFRDDDVVEHVISVPLVKR